MIKEQYIKSLIQVAIDDLKSSKLLYKHKMYPQSMFLIQQSIEKSYKALGLISNQITINDLRDISHDYMKMLRKGIGKINETERESVMKKEILDTINHTQTSEFYFLSDDDIFSWFELIRIHKKENSPRKFTKKKIKELYSIALQLNNLTDVEKSEIIKMDSISNETMNKDGRINLAKFMEHYFTLNILGLMTSPHFQQSRYPLTVKNNVNCPIEVYTIETPIIKNHKKIVDLAYKSILFIQESVI